MSLPGALQGDCNVIEAEELVNDECDDHSGKTGVGRPSLEAVLDHTGEEADDLLGRALELCKSPGGIPVLFPLPLLA